MWHLLLTVGSSSVFACFPIFQFSFHFLALLLSLPSLWILIGISGPVIMEVGCSIIEVGSCMIDASELSQLNVVLDVTTVIWSSSSCGKYLLSGLYHCAVSIGIQYTGWSVAE